MSNINMTIWGITLAFIILWTFQEARSQHKFFKKKSKDQDFILPTFKSVFLIHFISNLIVVVIYNSYLIYAGGESESDVMSNLMDAVSNMYLYIGISIIIWVIVSLIGRVFLSKIILKIDQGTIINSLKFIIGEHIILYGGGAAYFFFLSSIS